MDRSRIWPAFAPSWIVHEDADLLAVDKPETMPTHAAEEARGDDLVTRLGDWLKARGDDPYLGVHQRLDRDTSGVLVFARRKAANRSLASQFEGRAVEKRYLAAVEGWPEQRKQTTVRVPLVEDQGLMVAARPGDRKAQMAVTHFKLRRFVRGGRRGRALVEVTLETGRMHQARAHLAHLGTPDRRRFALRRAGRAAAPAARRGAGAGAPDDGKAAGAARAGAARIHPLARGRRSGSRHLRPPAALLPCAGAGGGAAVRARALRRAHPPRPTPSAW